jgi:arylsulfatase A-like enzyme/thioredoxin-like negative regulator of GroEL
VDARTPTLDRLALEGVRFDQAIAPTPLTLPSHATVLTGLYPPAHGVRNNGMYALPDDATTLAEVLFGAGYRTGAFVGAYPLAAPFGLAQGFEVYDDHFGGVAGEGFFYSERRARDVNEAAGRWLRNLPPDQPFFAWVHYFDPHANYEPPPPYATLFAHSPYDGEVAYTDASLGVILGLLESSGRTDETVVIVTSDHGEGLGDHGESTHGLFVYESTLRVPLIVRLPQPLQTKGGAVRTVRNAVIREPVSLADLFPTVLDLAGLGAHAGVQGESLVPLMTGERTDRAGNEEPGQARPVYSESLMPRLEFGWAELSAVRMGGMKWIEAPRPELYDLAADPRESRNLAATDRSRSDALRSSLTELRSRLHANRPGESSRREMTEQEIATLQSLGYLQGGVGRKGGTDASGRAGAPRDPKDGVLLLNRLERGKALAKDGRLEEAAREFLEVLGEEPHNVAALWRLAETYLAAGRPADADRLLAGIPVDGAALYWLPGLRGRARQAMGDPEGALALYRQAIDREPDPHDSALRAVLLLRELGRGGEALELVDRVLGQAGRSAALEELAGDLARDAGDPARASRYYLRAIRSDPGIDSAWRSLARVAFTGPGMIEDPGEFAALAGDAGDLAGAKLALGLLELTGGRPERAVEPLRRGLELQPDDPDTAYFLGLALAESGDLAGAEAVLMPLVASRREMYQARRALALVRERQGRREEAISLLEEALAIRPGDAGSRAALDRLRAGP